MDLYSLPRTDFEQGIEKGLLAPVEGLEQGAPFLKAAKGKNLDHYDRKRINAKKLHKDRVEERLLKIGPLLDRKEEILCASDPEKEINKYATEINSNAQRIRFWFFSYLCFGQDSSMLFPHFFNCGKWDRDKRTDGPKWGRHSTVRGEFAGCRIDDEMQILIKKSYLALRADGKPMTAIYGDAMRKHFNAHAVTTQSGRKGLVSRDGNPLPTIDQYRYQLKKILGHDEIQRSRWGAAKYRRKIAEHRGKFSSSATNLHERVEADAYYCEDRPRGTTEGLFLEKLSVTRSVDTVSAMRLGIGFSLGKEDSDSYSAAMFCAAISKVKFCRLFGIKIEGPEWPSKGLPSTFITDRGPGIKRETDHNEYAGEGIIVREITPSGKGQSKAIVESSQRRITKTEEPAKHTLSELSVTQMAAREIRRLLEENNSADASGRMTPEMIATNVFPTPIGIWNFLDERGRNEGHLISFDTAVRRFLVKTEVRVGRDGVWLQSQRYSSASLREAGILQKVSRIGTTHLSAYMYPICVRYIWVEVDGCIIEVDAQLNLHDDEEMLYRSYADLEHEHASLNRLQIERRDHKIAVAADQKAKFEAETGVPWSSGKTKRGPLKQSRAAKDEQQAARAIAKGRKA